MKTVHLFANVRMKSVVYLTLDTVAVLCTIRKVLTLSWGESDCFVFKISWFIHERMVKEKSFSIVFLCSLVLSTVSSYA